MDRHLFAFINRMAGQAPVLDSIMLMLTHGVLPALLMALGVLWWWPGRHQARRRINVTLTLLAVLIALGLSSAAEFAYYRPRPYKVQKVRLLVERIEQTSFPSTHTAALAAAVTALPLPRRRLRYTVWMLVFWVAVSRIYVGVHYPTDVAAGWILGWLSGLLMRCNQDALQVFARRVVVAVEELF